MAKKQGKQGQKRLKITIHHVTTADDAARLSQAIDILLREVAREATQLGENARNRIKRSSDERAAKVRKASVNSRDSRPKVV